MDLVQILKRPEGKTLEFKRDLSSPDGALKTIVAFANTAGGTLLVGVEDRGRHVRGVPDPLDVEERLANLVSDRISPRIVPEIEAGPPRPREGLVRLGHAERVERRLDLRRRQVGLPAGDLAHGAAAFRGVLGDRRRAVVADQRDQAGDRGDRISGRPRDDDRA
jgi:hypothetical protein